jgi:hypothetical protein
VWGSMSQVTAPDVCGLPLTRTTARRRVYTPTGQPTRSIASQTVRYACGTPTTRRSIGGSAPTGSWPSLGMPSNISSARRGGGRQGTGLDPRLLTVRPRRSHARRKTESMPGTATEGASLLQSGVVAALVAAIVSLATLATTGRRARQDRQRELFAAAFETSIAYREFAYGVRRRKDDSSEEVARISGPLSETQTRFRSLEALLRVEAPRVGAAYTKLAAETRAVAGEQIRVGWESARLPPERTGRIEDLDFSSLAEQEAEYLNAVRDHLAFFPWWMRSIVRRLRGRGAEQPPTERVG